MKGRRAWLASALSVVVNAQADALETAPLDEDSAISGEQSWVRVMPEKAGDQHRPPLTKPSCSPNWLS